MMKTNFTILQENKSETYLGDVIGNTVTEENTFNEAIKGIERLEEKWHKEHIVIHGRTILSNTLLIAKLSHRNSINGISGKLRNNITKKIKEFIWGGENRKARVIWEIMLKHPKEGGTGVRDPTSALDATRVGILKKIITRDRQPWMRWCERKLTRVAKRWKTKEAMAATPSRKQLKELKDECLMESALKT